MTPPMTQRSPAAERAYRLRRHRIALGLCPKCGKVPPRPGTATCEECALRYAAYEANTRGKLIAAGLCYVCKSPTTKYRQCFECRKKARKCSSTNSP